MSADINCMKKYRVCSDHFTDDDFCSRFPRPLLKANAVPSVFEDEPRDSEDVLHSPKAHSTPNHLVTSDGRNMQARSRINPQKIPRPPNAFMIFANEWRKKLALQNPRESNKEISVRLGRMWKSMFKELKDKYFATARQVDAEHKRKYPDYVYNPKEARIRKAMRDQANRARTMHQQNQRQQHLQHTHHQAYNRQQQQALSMEARNEIINRTRLSGLPRQASSSNIQSNHNMSHLLLPQHVLQHKPNHPHLQQVNHGICTEACNQQWIVGFDHRPAFQHPQQDLTQSQMCQEQAFDKTKASIREQVEQGILDDGYDLIEMETLPYTTARVVEVSGSGAGDGVTERTASEQRGATGSQIIIPTGQEFTVFTDVNGHQHWYPCIQADEIKVFGGGPMNNSWSLQQEQQTEQRMQHQQHLQENHNMKIQAETEQSLPMQYLIGTESSTQVKTEQTADYSYQRITAVPSSEINSNEEESSQEQQYFIYQPATHLPQVKITTQPKSEMEGKKENSNKRETSKNTSADGISSAVRTNSDSSHSNSEDLEERNPDLLPLPAFQQAFGSTEIGRFANEGFLSQSPETPSWIDPSSPYGLPSPTSVFNPSTTASFYPSPRGEEMTHTIPFPHSLANYFDSAIFEEIGESVSGYGDLMGLGEGPGFDLLTLHVQSVDNLDRDGGPSFSAIPGEMHAGHLSQESSDLTLLTPLGTTEL